MYETDWRPSSCNDSFRLQHQFQKLFICTEVLRIIQRPTFPPLIRTLKFTQENPASYRADITALL